MRSLWERQLWDRLEQFNQTSLGHGQASLAEENDDPAFSSLVVRTPLTSVDAVAVLRLPMDPRRHGGHPPRIPSGPRAFAARAP